MVTSCCFFGLLMASSSQLLLARASDFLFQYFSCRYFRANVAEGGARIIVMRRGSEIQDDQYKRRR